MWKNNNQPYPHDTATHPRSRLWLMIGAGAVVALLAGNVALAFHNIRELRNEADWVEHTHHVLRSLRQITALTKAEESDIRGYVITGQPTYLETYQTAQNQINEQAETVARLTTDNDRQQARIPALQERIAAKLSVMELVIITRREQGTDAAAQLIVAGQPEATMTALRSLVAEMIQEEQQLLQARSQQHQRTYRTALLTSGLSGLAGLGAIAAFIVLLRRYLASRTQVAEQMGRLRTTLASIGDAVITTDTEGQVTSLNAVAESLTGWHSNDAAGQPLTTIFQIVNEYTREPVDNPALRALAEGAIVGLANHTILIARDGTEHPIDDSAAPIRYQDGDIIGAVLVFRDITERRQAEERLQQSEERFRALVEASAAIVWTTNEAGEFDTPQPSWSEYTGQTWDELKGFGWVNALHSETRSQIQKLWEEARSQRSLYRSDGLLWHAPSQSYRYFEATGVPICNPDGSLREWVGMCVDVHERKQIEAEIQEARSRLESTLTAGEVGTWEFDVVNDRVQADRNLAQIFGVTPAEAAGGPVDAYIRAIHPEDQAQVMAILEEAIESGDQYRAEYRLQRPEGDRWIVARGRVERDESGQALRMPGVALDMTAQRQAEAQLRESEARFRQIADTMPQLVWVTGPDGSNEYFNRRWYEYTGSPPEECLGHGWSHFLHPDDQQRTLDRWHHSLQTGELYEIEYRFRSQTGEYRWFLGRALPVRNDAGQIVKWFGTCTDIEDFKHLEEDRQKFVWLADNSTDFIGISDMALVPIYLNPAGRKMIGIDQMESMGRIRVQDCFFPEDQDSIVNNFFPSVLENGNGCLEIRFRHFITGEALWMIYNVSVLTNAQGEAIGFATVSQNITERRQMEQDLRQLAADLSESDRRKDEFLATLAHELRNPLAPILNGIEIMKMAPADDRTQRVQTIMERQVIQMVRLIDDLLDMSRISQGKIELRRERVELASVIEQAIETSRPAIESSQHELIVTQPPQPLYLNADAVRLAQVFSNLLTNASKYSEPGGQIQLTVEPQGSEVIVSVRDTGIGIGPEMLPHIFDLFTQVEGALTRSQGGLGIGLTLVKQLVEMHGGSVSATSPGLGQGSEFTVRLPCLTNEATTQQPDEDAMREAETTNRRILIVDDNEDAAWSLELLFESTGDETCRAADGLAALEAAESFRPDIVLLDIGLPGLNGYELARRIREQSWGQDMVLVALTGWGQEADRRQSNEAGFNAHMVKPIQHAELLQLLVELLPQ